MPEEPAPPVLDAAWFAAYEARLLSVDEESQRRLDRIFDAQEEFETRRPRPW